MAPKKPESKAAADLKPSAIKSKKKAVASVEPTAVKPTTPKLVVPTQSSTSPLEESLLSSITFPFKRVWS
jgi:hypothetical protein